MDNQKKILVIDDEIAIGEIIRDTLSSEFSVDFASHPDDALEALKDPTYSIVLSDINMPKIPGTELVRILRSQGNVSPVMFISGYVSKETALVALRLGVADIIEKPFDPDLLLESVKRVLEIDKRKTQLILDRANGGISAETIAKKEKMLGLLQVVNEKKKTGS